MIGFGINLEELIYEYQQREAILDQFAFWARYVSVLIDLLDEDIKSIQSMIMENPLKYATMR